MLSSIHPLGERARNTRWSHTVTAHVLGALLAGGVVGGVAGTLGWGLRTLIGERAALVIVSVAAVGAALHELGVGRWRLPSWRRQVNEDWIGTYRGWVYGLGYGVQLGSGFATIIVSPATHVLGLLAVLTGSPLLGGIVGGIYGAVRGGSILAGRSITSPDRLVEFHRSMARWATPVRRSSAGVLAVTGLAAVAAVLR